MNEAVSVLTIAAGRADHLANVVRGLAAQTRPPAELIIAVMQGATFGDLPQAPFPVRQVLVPPRPNLPLAAARNAAARAAQSEILAFVDVDCIPGPDFVADYASIMAETDGLLMGEVGYLPAGAAAEIDFDRFEAVAERHPDRRGPPARGRSVLCNDYRCFWSLTFAMRAADFHRAGGFDERYEGYGGEDTDFGRTLDACGIPMYWITGAKVFHQHHPHCMPPVHHVASVVRNAELFATKWGHRTMEHWLYAFRRLGLVEDTERGLRILRAPDAEVMALCTQQADMPYATTRRVLDLLDGKNGALPPEAQRREMVEAAQSALLTARAGG
ncbi:GT2 family glycosyltransferase [Palleronia aestuarii]|uniref:GT2 family glycosyltransferase n=1 Tax=Palleronia aestuarii TaxID=568105 RepID=A0A2W7N994_9RHOB|nr:galactosyltransferase-related protein [Palleronia aestuarii]PZX16223.1 GT2 family glycosyltransferase [Palleronia aestuarii]